MGALVTCSCGQRFKAHPRLYGKRVKCPSCGNALDVPVPKAPTRSAAPIPVTCQCGQQFRAQPNLLGKTLPCPACGSGITIAAADADVAGQRSTSDDWGLDLAATAPPAALRPQRTLSHTQRPARQRKPVNLRPFVLAGIGVVGFVLLGLVLSAAWSAVSQAMAKSQQIDWQQHDGGPYTITFPFKPRENRVGPGPPEWKATRGKLTATATYTPIPRQRQSGPDWQTKILDMVVSMQPSGRRLVSVEDIEFHGHPGKQCVYEVKVVFTPARMHTRLYIVDGNLYELNWVVPVDNLREEEMAKFFDSFVVKGIND